MSPCFACVSVLSNSQTIHLRQVEALLSILAKQVLCMCFQCKWLARGLGLGLKQYYHCFLTRFRVRGLNQKSSLLIIPGIHVLSFAEWSMHAQLSRDLAASLFTHCASACHSSKRVARLVFPMALAPLLQRLSCGLIAHLQSEL